MAISFIFKTILNSGHVLHITHNSAILVNGILLSCALLLSETIEIEQKIYVYTLLARVHFLVKFVHYTSCRIGLC